MGFTTNPPPGTPLNRGVMPWTEDRLRVFEQAIGCGWCDQPVREAMCWRYQDGTMLVMCDECVPDFTTPPEPDCVIG